MQSIPERRVSHLPIKVLVERDDMVARVFCCRLVLVVQQQVVAADAPSIGPPEMDQVRALWALNNNLLNRWIPPLSGFSA